LFIIMVSYIETNSSRSDKTWDIFQSFFEQNIN